MNRCVYEDENALEHRDATHQCPKCKRWYCEQCHEMFLPIDPRFPAASAMICPQCHYEVYELPKFARG